MKTNKSYSKRIKVTKNGKMLVRKAGQNHFNAKESGRRKKQGKKGLVGYSFGTNKDISRFLPGNKNVIN